MAGTDATSAATFLRLLDQNTTLRHIIERLPGLGLPDAWVAGGCLFQTAWNVLEGRHPEQSIKDYDIFYFDPQDLSAESEERVNREIMAAFVDLGCHAEARNQARVHLWYAREFGVEGYPRLGKSTDGVDRFLAICCMVAARKLEDGSIALYAPYGVDDILTRVMRPNPRFPDLPRDAYLAKAARWQGQWPQLRCEMPAGA